MSSLFLKKTHLLNIQLCFFTFDKTLLKISKETHGNEYLKAHFWTNRTNFPFR